jgi:hypothetical protein
MSDPPTVKAKIIQMLQGLPDDIDFERAIESIYVLQKVEVALEDVRQGEVYDDEEVMEELLGEHEVQAHLDSRGEG